ncbi:ATP-binding cassette domain-containing protein [Anaerocolumna jejuensis]|uniref:ATP-binding cassette domain-containing protein n=1 Tax=Anaerocolumna jejuensis TaxID=259063 RepID=UPI003F7CD220
MKERRFHTPLLKQYRRIICGTAMGASVKGKRFHTPLFKAVPQNYLRYAMGAKMKEKTNSDYLAGREEDILVRMRDVSFDYEGKRILRNINLALKKGASYSLIGKSGTGKSTLLNLAAGLLSPKEGSIEILSAPLKGTRKETAIMFQELALFPWQTVYQAASMPLKLSGKKEKQEIERRVAELLEELGLIGLQNKYPHQLSGGERQRAALARGLIGQPDLLLMDEPTSSLDSITKESIQELIIKQQQKLKATLLFVTHDMEEALILGESILLLNGDGTVTELENPCYFRKEQRKSIEFYEQCIHFKELLEESETR